MNIAQQRALQEYLLEAQAAFKKELKNLGLPEHLCLHLAPDMCWISDEFEYQEDHIPTQPTYDTPFGSTQKVIICNRKPPACHTVIVKL